ncbi:uncharacterized protein LOC106865760 isoform X2 [Brachypodium distachyon]|uniref:uncharacterized protein LOC106865760 isoform X2 n=1 Tax=Brachypodium distachyon TaxID=15368 RepID=UPI00071CCF6B|nr:uncharacterized protein LOC106865760 isoform X2 [Brachypodium distachyon]|eukprot:XP_014752018.1 uncharacterized protein LOC106865760 isoform X2 [Brachypodium distachyon]
MLRRIFDSGHEQEVYHVLTLLWEHLREPTAAVESRAPARPRRQREVLVPGIEFWELVFPPVIAVTVEEIAQFGGRDWEIYEALARSLTAGTDRRLEVAVVVALAALSLFFAMLSLKSRRQRRRVGGGGHGDDGGGGGGRRAGAAAAADSLSSPTHATSRRLLSARDAVMALSPTFSTTGGGEGPGTNDHLLDGAGLVLLASRGRSVNNSNWHGGDTKVQETVSFSKDVVKMDKSTIVQSPGVQRARKESSAEVEKMDNSRGRSVKDSNWNGGYMKVQETVSFSKEVVKMDKSTIVQSPGVQRARKMESAAEAEKIKSSPEDSNLSRP